MNQTKAISVPARRAAVQSWTCGCFPSCMLAHRQARAGWLTVLNSSYTFLSCSINFGLSCPDTSWQYAVTSACGAEQCALLVPVSICSLRGPLGWSVCWRCQNAWVQDLDLACAMRLVYKSNSLMPSHNWFSGPPLIPPHFFLMWKQRW